MICKAEQVSDELVYLAKISKQNVEGATWVFLATYSKMREEKEKMRGRTVKQKGTGT